MIPVPAAVLLLVAANNCDLVGSPQKSNISLYTEKFDGAGMACLGDGVHVVRIVGFVGQLYSGSA